MKPICVVYHCLIELGDPPTVRDVAVNIIREQMVALKSSGLLDVASEFIVGINGGDTSRDIASLLIPSKARIVMHGLQCRNECRTILMVEEWVKANPRWNVLYFHSKGATRLANDPMITNWRNCLMNHLVLGWWKCVSILGNRIDSVGCHWLTGQVDGTQNLWGGNFWWSTSEFIATLPSFAKNPRIPLMGGIDSEKSRYEAEVWIGSGPKLPKVKDFHPGWPFNCGK